MVRMLLLQMLLLLVLALLKFAIGQDVQFDVLAIKKCSRVSGWSIHGWWPEYSVDKWPQWCNRLRYNEFNKTAISSIQSQLDQYWYSCPGWNINNYQLLQHEWEKHGTCTPKSVLDYFEQGLTAFHTAGYNDWYHCCDNANTQCLIPFNPGTAQWLGWCDTGTGTYSYLLC